MLPFPGTPDASPQAEIGFPALSLSDVSSVAVDGSESGRHKGHLTSLPGGTGCVFVPDAPFAPGEKVTVDAVLTSMKAGAAVGKPGATTIDFTFSVAAPPKSGPASTTTTTLAASAPAQPSTWSYRSRPDLHPPVMSITDPDDDSSSGLVFVDTQFAPQPGAMIVDGAGDPIWFRPAPAGEWATDLQVQIYRGEPVLTWWQGKVVPPGHGLGECIIVDGSYQPVAVVRAAAGYQADLHEFHITSHDTALITAYQAVRGDLTSVKGAADGSILDSVVQEIDIQTGQLLWEWHALGHVPVSSSYIGPPADGSPFDFFHINSIQELPNGDLLISARNTWAVYRVDRATGAIEWQLGGKNGSFTMGQGTQFEWQHDARLQADGSLTLFNDAAAPKEESESRAMRLQLDLGAMRASLMSAYARTPSVLAGSQGSMQLLPNGNVFVGWGDQPNFSEFTADGKLIFDAAFPSPIQSYRAYRYVWTGRPADPPSVAIVPASGDRFTVYASWNGATGVARWEILAGASPGTVTQVIASTPATGFETAISAATSLSYLSVCALDGTGHVIGTTTLTR